MSLFDLKRLEGGAETFTFPARDGGEVVVVAHMPTAEEYSAALTEAGVDMTNIDDLKNTEPRTIELGARLGAARQHLACYCVDAVEGYEIKRHRGPFGLYRLTPEWEDQLQPVLLKIGSKLYNAANLSKTEGED